MVRIGRHSRQVARTFQLRKTKGFEMSIAVVIANCGERPMDEMRALLAEMEQEEQVLLAKVQARR